MGKVKGHSFGSQDPLSADQSTRMGYANALVRDLRTAYSLITKMCARQPWLDASLRRNGKQNSEWRIDQQQGVVYRQELSSVHSHRLVNALLSLYATSTYQYCKDNNVPVPLAWENRDRYAVVYVVQCSCRLSGQSCHITKLFMLANVYLICNTHIQGGFIETAQIRHTTPA